jgi:DNA-binding NarL/FixJ family response regulator
MSSAADTHLVIADDHPLFRDALRQAVASVVTSAKIDEAGSFEELTMPGISGFSGLIYLRAQYPAIPVVIVSASDDGGTIRRSLDFGASGFIPKRFGVDTLRDAIMKVMDGDVWIPPDTDLSSATDPEVARLRDRLVTLTPQQAVIAAAKIAGDQWRQGTPSQQ